jgi:hypothetical protein
LVLGDDVRNHERWHGRGRRWPDEHADEHRHRDANPDTHTSWRDGDADDAFAGDSNPDPTTADQYTRWRRPTDPAADAAAAADEHTDEDPCVIGWAGFADAAAAHEYAGIEHPDTDRYADIHELAHGDFDSFGDRHANFSQWLAAALTRCELRGLARRDDGPGAGVRGQHRCRCGV